MEQVSLADSVDHCMRPRGKLWVTALKWQLSTSVYSIANHADWPKHMGCDEWSSCRWQGAGQEGLGLAGPAEALSTWCHPDDVTTAAKQ